MIELKNDNLLFRFPKIHPRAKLRIELQRTLRIPDDGRTYPLPPGLGAFPLRHVDDLGPSVPASWLDHGGVVLPMYQSEALWLYFDSDYIADNDVAYPFAVKIAAGKINAVTGEDWANGLDRDPQDYIVVPEQPWLDGYCVERGTIRQFVAMPLGSGYSAEEQIRGSAEYGGLQIIAYPMKPEVFERRFPRLPEPHESRMYGDFSVGQVCTSPDMGLAPGGAMHQEIYSDPFDIEDWAQDSASRCFVHIANSLVWRAITGEQPPSTPPTAREYTDRGMPWFDYYADADAECADGSTVLRGLQGVAGLGKAKGDNALPENESVAPEKIVQLRRGLGKHQVREGRF
ncbi:MAG: hypothetical protein ACE5E4_09120 [Candidatus Binatia bacterium]